MLVRTSREQGCGYISILGKHPDIKTAGSDRLSVIVFIYLFYSGGN